MKNLKLVTELSLQLDLQLQDETLLLSAFDIERSRVFFASSANFLYTLHVASSQQGLPWSEALFSSEPAEVSLEHGDYIVAMDYLIEKEALLLGSSSGHLILHNVGDTTAEFVGIVEGGVKSIASSPDGSLLSITTGLGQLLIMTDDWEVLYEVALKPETSNNEDAGNTFDSSTGQMQSPVTWRGDGKYFATLGAGKLNGSSCLRKLMVWERESGMLHSSSEPKSFIRAPLDWMPSGAKVAAVYDRTAEGKCPAVVFFEKNGLERSSFSIDETIDASIEFLKWNCNSELLAASITCQQYYAIKIWSCSNNHWYLKQEIRYSKRDSVKFTWDPTKPLNLICWTLGGRITAYKFAWTTAVTETSIALVVDNSSILVTPLTLSVMPPPMSLFSLKFHCAVRDVSFMSNNSKNHLAAFLSDGSLCVLELPTVNEWDRFEGNEIKIEACRCDFTLENVLHLTWINSHMLLGAPVYPNSSKDNANDCGSFFLQEIKLVCSEDSLPDSVNSSGWQAKISKKFTVEGPVVSIVSNPGKRSSAFVQISGGTIVEYSSSMNSLKAPTHFGELDPECGFPSSCPWMRAVLCHDKGIIRPLLFGLDDNSRLRVGKRMLSNSCSGFTFFSSTGEPADQMTTHLLFTTKQDILFIIGIDDILSGTAEVKTDEYFISQHGRRESKDHIALWEKGAKLIGVLHGDEAAAILQTNRGNLESIYPRKLVLVSIINALNQSRFKDAMSMVRRHRIDFNIIVDCSGWTSFIKSAPEFVTQVNNLAHITEFVCSIKNENIIDKLYKAYTSLPNCSETLTSHTNKVSSVLLAVRNALKERVGESPSRELCILTTLARSDPPLLEEALNRVKLIRESELTRADDGRRKLYPSAEESLKHLLWLTDQEAMFDAALGLYDLNLAAIVALNSQKDPKEFLPFLKQLESLPPAVMKYTIDLRLHRYESALKHIVSAGDEYYEDFMKLLNSNPELFPLGLQLVTDQAKRRRILEAWGDCLYDNKCFADAAATYLCCSLYQKSLRAYRACGDWKRLFSVAGLLKLEKEQMLQLANDICEEFQALGKLAEAARIALEYCTDVARGVGYYIQAHEWEEALGIAYMHERGDLVVGVRDAALECAAMLVSEYEEGSLKVGKYSARYLAVRQRRLVLSATVQSGERSKNDFEDDTISEVSTSFSEMSAYTTRSLNDSSASITTGNTSKTRASRHQRKGGKIRAGSPREEMALVEHLKGMSLTAGAQRDLKSLITTLLLLEKEEPAQLLQHTANNFDLVQKAAVKLAEDTIANESIDEKSHTLENYVKMLRASAHPESSSWQINMLLTPFQVKSAMEGKTELV